MVTASPDPVDASMMQIPSSALAYLGPALGEWLLLYGKRLLP
jgi:hypothetical protein